MALLAEEWRLFAPCEAVVTRLRHDADARPSAIARREVRAGATARAASGGATRAEAEERRRTCAKDMPIGKSQLLMKCPARPHQNIDGFQKAGGGTKILRRLAVSARARK